MEIKRKVACVLRGAMLAALVLGPGFAHAWEKGKLTIWVGDERAARGMRQIAATYTQKTGVKVTVQVPPKPTEDFQRAMAAGNGPDIFLWAHDTIGEWSARGWLAPVTLPAAIKKNLVEVAIDGVTSKGKVWAYPLAVEALSLVYNKALIATPPKTFEEIPALQASLKAKGVHAIGWEVNDPYSSWPLLAAGGAYVFQRDLLGNYDTKKVGVNHPGAVRGAEVLASFVRSGVLSGTQSTADAEAALRSGKLAMALSGPWVWESLSKAGIRYGIAPIPSLGGQPARPFVGVQALMLAARSPNHAEAAQMIEQYLVSAEGLRAFNKVRPLGIPASKEIFWDFYSDPQIRQAMESVFTGKSMPNNKEMAAFWKVMRSALEQISAGTRKPKDALDDAAKRIASGG
jgi:maltose/maltodextrin transport system substrate-binding protein